MQLSKSETYPVTNKTSYLHTKQSINFNNYIKFIFFLVTMVMARQFLLDLLHHTLLVLRRSSSRRCTAGRVGGRCGGAVCGFIVVVVLPNCQFLLYFLFQSLLPPPTLTVVLRLQFIQTDNQTLKGKNYTLLTSDT